MGEKGSEMTRELTRIPLFRILPPAELQRLATVCEAHRFRKGEVLFREAEPAAAVWVIQHGWVHLLKQTPYGATITVFTVTPDEVLCGFSAVVGEKAYYASAVAATDTSAVRIPKNVFSSLIAQQPGFAEQVLMTYHTRMRHMAQAISLAQAPVEQRLAYVLMRLHATFGKTVPITHHELAQMAGTRWETSIRTLSAMKRKGWLTSSRGRVTIVTFKPLRALLTNHRPRG